MFGKLVKVRSDGIRHAFLAHVARLPGAFFANAITYSGNSLMGSAKLISKFHSPRVAVLGDGAGVHLAGTG